MSLFDDLPAPPPAKPKRTTAKKGEVRYDRYAGLTKCADCITVAYETLLDGKLSVRPILRARFKRLQGDATELLCNAHAALRKEDEPQ